MTSYQRTLTVASGATQGDQVRAYLYRTATVVGTALSPTGRRLVTVVAVVSEDSDREAEFLAQYQAERLASGLYGARVFGTSAEAWAYVGETLTPAEFTR
ncbi:MAG TPA: hypothetical protein VF062_22340 [Candidatus Limnocylindrales bacterium]